MLTCLGASPSGPARSAASTKAPCAEGLPGALAASAGVGGQAFLQPASLRELAEGIAAASPACTKIHEALVAAGLERRERLHRAAAALARQHDLRVLVGEKALEDGDEVWVERAPSRVEEHPRQVERARRVTGLELRDAPNIDQAVTVVLEELVRLSGADASVHLGCFATNERFGKRFVGPRAVECGMEIVRPSRWVAQPWRNGGGTTHEIVREGTSDTFTFRMSVADVARDGPFSLFAGIDRWIVLLEGCGFTLHGGRSSHTLEQPFAPHRFAGEEPIVCTLRDGPVRDLNVMAARDRLELAVEAVVVSEVRALAPPARATRGYVFVLAGPLLLEGARLERHDLAVRAALPLEIRGVGEALVIWSTPRAPG